MSLYEVSNNKEFALSKEIIYSAWKKILLFKTESHFTDKNFRNIKKTVAAVCKE